ncbi:hypothetical protein GB937_000260 [Aspergillus fischeri]|nr:hypothetical protein GB937_000260 [Aspergillus fischeri]
MWFPIRSSADTGRARFSPLGVDVASIMNYGVHYILSLAVLPILCRYSTLTRETILLVALETKKSSGRGRPLRPEIPNTPTWCGEVAAAVPPVPLAYARRSAVGRGAEGMTVLVIIAVTMTSCSLLVRDPGRTSVLASGLGSISPMVRRRDSMIATRGMRALARIGGNAM